VKPPLVGMCVCVCVYVCVSVAAEGLVIASCACTKVQNMGRNAAVYSTCLVCQHVGVGDQGWIYHSIPHTPRAGYSTVFHTLPRLDIPQYSTYSQGWIFHTIPLLEGLVWHSIIHTPWAGYSTVFYTLSGLDNPHYSTHPPGLDIQQYSIHSRAERITVFNTLRVPGCTTVFHTLPGLDIPQYSTHTQGWK
jgi:hypothetical protein